MKKLALQGRASDTGGRLATTFRGPIRLRELHASEDAPRLRDAALVRSAQELQDASERGYRQAVALGEVSIQSSDFDLSVKLPIDFGYLRHDDVIAFNPYNRSVRTLFRANSSHNWFFVTERCDNYCLMCSQPPRQVDDAWLLDEIKSTIPLIAAETASLGFTGGEPLLNWKPFIEVLELAREALPSTSLHVLTNGRAFARPEVVSAWAKVGHPNLMAGIPLYAGTDAQHDYVVQARGAFAETVEGILRLKDKKQAVEIRIVLHKLTAPRLVQTCEWIARNLPFVDHVALMGLEHTGFALANDSILWIDPHEYKPSVAESVEILRCAGVRTSLYNLPLCLVDETVWDITVQSISDWKNDYLPQCDACAVRDRCAGFFTSGRPKFSDHIAPFPAVPAGLMSEANNGAPRSLEQEPRA